MNAVATARMAPLPVLLATLCLFLPAALPALADNAAPASRLDATEAMRASQAVIGRRIGDYTLLDRESRPVKLSSYRGKPLLVSFIYTGCFQVCPTTTQALRDTVRGLRGRFGAGQFNVVSIGFNQPADSPMALKAFALRNGSNEPNWNFLSPPMAIVEPLTRDFGFRYLATPAGFDHVLQVTLLDADGRIAKQVYGERASAELLGEPMKQLLTGGLLPERTSLSDLIDRVRVLCTVYDPETGSYRTDYGLALELAGGVGFILAFTIFMLNEWRNHRAARRRP
ncbi:MAG: SCO family protein [Caldimonas sp.]